MELFQGYNTLTGAALTKAVAGTPDKPAGVTKSMVSLCTDTESVFKSLEVNASVAGSYGMFSADAKFHFVQDMKLTTNSIVVLVYCSMQQTYTSSDFKIMPEADAMIAPGKTSNFIASYGNTFVSSVTKGAEYMAAFVFYSETLEQKLVVEASLGFKVNGGGGSLDASLSTKLQNAQSSAKVRMSLVQSITGFSGGSVTLPAADADSIIKFGLAFSSLKPDEPTTVSFGVTGYENAGITSPDELKPVIASRRLFDGDGSPGNPGLALTYSRLSEVLNMTVQIKNLLDFYGFRDDDLANRRTAIIADMNAVRANITALGDAPLAAHTFAPAMTYQWGAPEANFELRSITGGGTTSWNNPQVFADITQFQVFQYSRIKSVQVNVGDRVDMVTVVYETQLPALDTRTVIHGSPGGTPHYLNLNAGEWINYFSQWQDGWALNNVRIGTTAGQTVLPKPAGASPLVTWQAAPGNDFVVGFAGTASNNGGDVNDLDLQVVHLLPVKWVAWTDQLKLAMAA